MVRSNDKLGSVALVEASLATRRNRTMSCSLAQLGQWDLQRAPGVEGRVRSKPRVAMARVDERRGEKEEEKKSKGQGNLKKESG